MSRVRSMLLSIGDNCIDIYVAPIAARHVGGNALNVAANFALHGLPAAYAGVVGTDAFGAAVLAALRAIGVNSECVTQVATATGVTEIALKAGDYQILSESYGASDAVAATPELLRFARERASWIHLTVSGRAPQLIDAVRALAAPLSIDLGAVRTIASLAGHARLLRASATVFISTGSELADASVEALLQEALRLGAAAAVASRGERGASTLVHGRLLSVPSRVGGTGVIDPLGAGDAFIAGFLSRSATQTSMEERLECGSAWAASACAHIGAWPSNVQPPAAAAHPAHPAQTARTEI